MESIDDKSPADTMISTERKPDNPTKKEAASWESERREEEREREKGVCPLLIPSRGGSCDYEVTLSELSKEQQELEYGRGDCTLPPYLYWTLTPVTVAG